MIILKRNPHEYARDYALRVIRYNIIELELKPGSMVSENELASELGLSRGPVREALIELANVEIVEVYPQRGSVIALVDYDLVEEARFVRTTLETAVVERLCDMGPSPQDINKLRENLQLQQLYLDNENISKLWGLDNEFHAILFSAAGVARAHSFMRSMQLHFDRIRFMGTTVLAGPRNIVDHSEILEAVASRDSGLAKRLMYKHLTNYQIDKQSVYEKYPQYVKQ
ncbi:MAG: GntR family transcriptional regulator [Clostridiales bacterium]|jgi:DNA-binding GntR family transcriptional regulator|nr:GntR family transcriptional regulator [Clostridiales bacterium]